MIQIENGESLSIAQTLYESGNFEYAHPSFTRFTGLLNEFHENQWGLNNTGQYNGNFGIDINASQAWGITKGNRDIVIALIDQGVDLDHPDLSANLITGYDATDGGLGGLYGDCWGNDAHGTCCAGIIASVDNLIGTIGVAPDCRIIPIRTTYSINDIEIWDDDWVVDALNYAWEEAEADILSCSWSYSIVTAISNEINSALNYGRNNRGCVVVFAVGNRNVSVSYPANLNPDILAVGAMSQCGERKRSSSDPFKVGQYVWPDPQGVSCDTENRWGSNYGNELDIVAPGVLISTTDIQGDAGYNPNLFCHTLSGGSLINSDYEDEDFTNCFNGTSAAVPHVSGVAALILSINPNLTQDQVRDIIESTAQKVGGYNYSTVQGRTNGTWYNQMGYGLIDAYAAVIKAAGGPITGQSLVCSSGTTFSISPIASFDSVKWEKGPFLNIGSGQGTATCTISATGDSISFVKVTVYANGHQATLPEKIVWAGKPVTTSISGPSPFYDEYGCTGQPYSCWTVPARNALSQSSYEWAVEPSYFSWYFQYQYYDWVTIVFNDPYEYYQVRVRATNTCGASIWVSKMVSITDCYRFLLYPNPASGEVTISLTVAESVKKEEVPSNILVQITDKSGIKLYSATKSGDSFTIPVSNLKDGNYIVSIIYDGKIENLPLIIKN